MLNQATIVGRVKELESGLIVVGVMNIVDNYEELIDIPVEISGNIAKMVLGNCHKGDLMGVRGKLINKNGNIMISAEKITFLSKGGDK